MLFAQYYPSLSNIAASTKDSRSLLKAVMTVEEFKISVPQQRELENIKGNLLHNDINASEKFYDILGKGDRGGGG